MKKAIISGATGAIGMALIQELVEHQVEVLVLCREGSGRNEQIQESTLVKKCECSLEDLHALKNQGEKSYDVFFHFAWKGTNGTARNDMFLQNQNVRYSLDAVEVAHRFGCHTFIGAGSQAEYGREMDGRKLTPGTPAFPETGYGIAKLCAGMMTREHAHQLGMQHIWCRILSVYGPYDGKQSMVMSGIDKMLHGEHASYTKGEQMWDYLYSRDAARAFYLMSEKGKDGATYCLGSGQVRPLKEYIECIRKETDEQASIGYGEVPYYDHQVMYLCADIHDLTRDTGFEPIYRFEEGIRETVAWCRDVSAER